MLAETLDLVARDPGVPALGLLLDAEAAAELLGRCYPAAGIVSARPRYIRYKPGTSCLVLYEVSAGAGPAEVYVRAHDPRARDKLAKAGGRAAVHSPLGGSIVVLREQAAVAYPFPNDHELPALRALGHPATRAALLAEILPERPDLWSATLERLRYKPERRFVARLGAQGDGAVVKLYSREDFRGVKHHGLAFAGSPPLRVPRRLARCPGQRATAAEWMEGEGLWELVGRGASGAACRLTGAALAALHAQRPPNGVKLAHTTAEQYVSALRQAAAAVGEIAPHLGQRCAHLALRSAEAVLEQPWCATGAVHGDFSPDQVVVRKGEAAFLDFDRAGCGDPRQDLGSFGARVAAEALWGAMSQDDAEAAFAALVEGYGGASHGHGVAPFVAAGLLRLATEPFRHCRERWPDLMSAIIDRTAEVIEGSGGWNGD